MDKNFIELLIWIIAYEFTKDHGTKDDHQKVFQKICESQRTIILALLMMAR
jgi:hypothetical protein